MKYTHIAAIGIPYENIKNKNLINRITIAILNATLKDTKFEMVEDKGTKSGWTTVEKKYYDIDDNDIIGINESLIYDETGNVDTTYLNDIIEKIQAKIYTETNKYINVMIVGKSDNIHKDLFGIHVSASDIKIKMGINDKWLPLYIYYTFGNKQSVSQNYTPIVLIKNAI